MGSYFEPLPSSSLFAWAFEVLARTWYLMQNWNRRIPHWGPILRAHGLDWIVTTEPADQFSCPLREVCFLETCVVLVCLVFFDRVHQKKELGCVHAALVLGSAFPASSKVHFIMAHKPSVLGSRLSARRRPRLLPSLQNSKAHWPSLWITCGGPCSRNLEIFAGWEGLWPLRQSRG